MSDNPYQASSDPSSSQMPGGAAPPPPPPAKKGVSGCAIAGIGCAVVLLLALILGGIAVWYAATNARSMGGATIRLGLTESVQQSNLPADEKQQLVDEINQQTADYQQELITHEAYFQWVGQFQENLENRIEQADQNPTPLPSDPANGK